MNFHEIDFDLYQSNEVSLVQGRNYEYKLAIKIAGKKKYIELPDALEHAISDLVSETITNLKKRI